MQFNLRTFLESGRKPYMAHFEADFSQADFGGYSVNAPAVCDFTATLTEDGAALLLCVKAHVDAECARCLGTHHPRLRFPARVFRAGS